jgi:hypothetical protein
MRNFEIFMNVSLFKYYTRVNYITLNQKRTIYTIGCTNETKKNDEYLENVKFLANKNPD